MRSSSANQRNHSRTVQRSLSRWKLLVGSFFPTLLPFPSPASSLSGTDPLSTSYVAPVCIYISIYRRKGGAGSFYLFSIGQNELPFVRRSIKGGNDDPLGWAAARRGNFQATLKTGRFNDIVDLWRRRRRRLWRWVARDIGVELRKGYGRFTTLV